MKKLYFVRHGESKANAKELFAGRWDVPLTRKGKAQALKAGQEAKGLRIDLMISSPLKRAKNTAQIIAKTIGYPPDEIMYSDLFMERGYGELQGKPWGGVDVIDFSKVPGIESEQDLIKRAEDGAKLLRSLPQENILFVGHGTNGRAVLRALLKQTGEVEVTIEQEIQNARPVRWI